MKLQHPTFKHVTVDASEASAQGWIDQGWVHVGETSNPAPQTSSVVPAGGQLFTSSAPYTAGDAPQDDAS